MAKGLLMLSVAVSLSAQGGVKKPFLKTDGPRKSSVTRQAKRAADNAVQTVVDEDFSKFTKGSESDPVRLEYQGYYLPDNLTAQPGWMGKGIAEAGGACAILNYVSEYWGETTGYLDTPEMYLYGETTLIFKAKVLNASSGEIWVPICDAYDGPMDSKTFQLTDQWQEFSYTTHSATAYPDNYYQFTPQECEVLIDEVKVIVNHDKVEAPYTRAPENLSLTSFRAGWDTPVPVDKIYLTVYSKEPPTDYEEGVLTEDFNSVNLTPGTDKIDSSNPGYPEGWNSDVADAIRNVGYAKNSTGLILQKEGEFVESASTPLPIESFSFWVKPSNMRGEDYAISLLQVSVYSNQWTVIANLPNYWMNANGGKYEFGPEAIGEGVTKIKLQYLQEGAASVAFTVTDFVLNYHSADVKVPLVDNLELDGKVSEYVVNGLVPEKDYYYVARAAIGDIVSEESYPWWVDGIVGLAPKALPATDVTETSFTANWEPLPHATEYSVKVFQLTTATEDMEDVTVIEENFDKITTGTLDNPGYDFISPYDFGANGMANADWQATQPRWIKGMAGSAGISWYGSAGLVTSPYLTLTNGGGAFDVEFTALATEANDEIFCMIIDNINASQALEAYTLKMGAAGELKSGKIHFPESKKNRKNVMVAFMSMSGTMFFVTDIRISQNLKAGEALVSTLRTVTSQTPYVAVTDLSPFSDYAYSVSGSTTREFNNYNSEPSDEIMVPVASKVEGVGEETSGLTVADGIIRLSGLTEGETAVLYDLQGRKVAHAVATDGNCSISAASGLYLLRTTSRTYKIAVK